MHGSGGALVAAGAGGGCDAGRRIRRRRAQQRREPAAPRSTTCASTTPRTSGPWSPPRRRRWSTSRAGSARWRRRTTSFATDRVRALRPCRRTGADAADGRASCLGKATLLASLYRALGVPGRQREGRHRAGGLGGNLLDHAWVDLEYGSLCLQLDATDLSACTTFCGFRRRSTCAASLRASSTASTTRASPSSPNSTASAAASVGPGHSAGPCSALAALRAAALVRRAPARLRAPIAAALPGRIMTLLNDSGSTGTESPGRPKVRYERPALRCGRRAACFHVSSGHPSRCTSPLASLAATATVERRRKRPDCSKGSRCKADDEVDAEAAWCPPQGDRGVQRRRWALFSGLDGGGGWT